MSYTQQEPDTHWARHDLGQDPQPYTITEMIEPEPDGFGEYNELSELVIQVYNKATSRYLKGRYTLDPDTFVATMEGGSHSVVVELDEKQGIWCLV